MENEPLLIPSGLLAPSTSRNDNDPSRRNRSELSKQPDGPTIDELLQRINPPEKQEKTRSFVNKMTADFNASVANHLQMFNQWNNAQKACIKAMPQDSPQAQLLETARSRREKKTRREIEVSSLKNRRAIHKIIRAALLKKEPAHVAGPCQAEYDDRPALWRHLVWKSAHRRP